MRLGLIGCGRWGRNILRDLVALGCEVSVAVPGGESAAAAKSGGASLVVQSHQDLPRVDGIVVAVPTCLHGGIVLEILAARPCPVYCEKPLTADVSKAREIVRRGADRVFVMDKWRYHPGIQSLGHIARSGELGPVLGLKTVRLGWGNPHADVDAAWILLPHDLTIALEITGRIPKPVRAAAESDSRGLMTLSAWLEDGYWMSCEVSARYPGHQRAVELRCAAGVARLTDAYDQDVQVLRTDRWSDGGQPPAWELRPVGNQMPLLAELTAFVEHLRGGPPPRSSAADGLRVVETITTLRAMAGLPG